jgi:hypothetical protein
MGRSLGGWRGFVVHGKETAVREIWVGSDVYGSTTITGGLGGKGLGEGEE